MNKKKIGIILSVILGGTVLFAGYKTIEKRENKKINEVLGEMVENNKNDEKIEDIEEEKEDIKEDKDEDNNEIKENKVEANTKPQTTTKPPVNNKPAVNNKIDEENDVIGIYKKGVTEGQVEALKEEFDKKSNFRYIYGTSFGQNGGGPIYETGRELEGAKMFYEEVDTTLNELWGALRKILKPDVYKRLQENQLEWIKERDKIASTMGKPGDMMYIDKQGRETCKRIRYLIDNYLD
ncbi:MAG: lysozyme inhibitor LprI family protein [Clostridium sp.]